MCRGTVACWLRAWTQDTTELKPRLCHRCLGNLLSSACLNFPICKMEVLKVTPLKAVPRTTTALPHPSTRGRERCPDPLHFRKVKVAHLPDSPQPLSALLKFLHQTIEPSPCKGSVSDINNISIAISGQKLLPNESHVTSHFAIK